MPESGGGGTTGRSSLAGRSQGRGLRWGDGEGDGGDAPVVGINEELALRKAEEAASRRFQAVQWLRQMDQAALASLPEKPSEEELCLALRNGLILCNVLNRVNPGSIPKVVENPVVAVYSTDVAAQSAIQYFENVRNFLVAVREMKLLAFEASDLEKGGSLIKVVDCILCLKGYHEWKLAGGVGIWRYGGTVKITSPCGEVPFSFPSEGSVEELPGDSTSVHMQQLLQVLQTFGGISMQEPEISNCLCFLLDKFEWRLLQAYLTKADRDNYLPLDTMLIDKVLDNAVEKFCRILVSRRDQLGTLLKRTINDTSKCLSKAELLKTISKTQKEYETKIACSSCCICGQIWEPKRLCDNPNSSNAESLHTLQKQVEDLKSLCCSMKVQVWCNQQKWAEEFRAIECHMQGLGLAASSYHKILEENRILYNQIQDLKGSIRVYCRVKPLFGQTNVKSTVDFIGENGNIIIAKPNRHGKESRKTFLFDKVFGSNATQLEVFADIRPLIRSVLDGYNVCIFAYGQTGSGKTYTMSGPEPASEETWGVNYRTLNDLFLIMKSRVDIVTYEVCVQMIEIYNEQVRDLLTSHGPVRRLDVRNNYQANGLNIPDASIVSVKCTQDVFGVMKIGQGNRAVGATTLNELSSRSHSVLTVHVQGKELVSGSILRGCLHLVDLAGSERVDKSEAVGERLKEAQHINKSLSALGDVISALSHKNAHIPYRNSKLTHVLQGALGGQAKTLMFVHINPEVNAIGETISTLKFAERVALIELGPTHANKEAGEVRELKDEISNLKLALGIKESEVEHLKNSTSQIGLKAQKPRAASSVQLQRDGTGSHIKEANQLGIDISGNIEFRSCSLGKQRNSLFPSLYTEKEPGEICMSSRNFSSPSPPRRRSLRIAGGSLIKTKPKIEKPDEMTSPKLQCPEKCDEQSSALETTHSRRVNPEPKEQKLKLVLCIQQDGARNTMEIKAKPNQCRQTTAQTSNMSIREQIDEP